MLGLVRGLFPAETDFFVLFEQNARTIAEAGRVLVQGFEHPEALATYATRLKDLEHAADEVTHQVMAGLNRSFVTALDRGDIADLARALDDVVDCMEEALTRAMLFKLYQPSECAQELAHVALQQAELIARTMPLLQNSATRSGIQNDLIEINRLENAADRMLDEALTTLYDEPPDLTAIIDRIKWREVYELIETATDRAEDVANVLERIVSQNA
jgi:uncharacterized protein